MSEGTSNYVDTLEIDLRIPQPGGSVCLCRKKE